MSAVLGMIFNFIGINPIKALFWSGVVNGLLAPFLLVGILIIASDKKIMKGQPSFLLSRIVVALTAVIMFGAGAALILMR